MKIAVVVPNYPPTICGVGDYTYHKIQEFLKAGIEVHVICSVDQKPELAAQPVIYPMIKVWNATGFKSVLDKLDDIKPDWVIVEYVPHGFEPHGLPIAVLGFYKGLTRRKYNILTVFHEVRVRPGNKLSSRFISAVETYLARKIVQYSTKVVTSIDFYADLLRGGNNLRKISNLPKISVIPIGTGIMPIATNATIKENFKKRFNIPSNAPIIVTFGNRNVTEYLAAFDKLNQDIHNFIWLLCGKTSTPMEVLESRSYLRNTGKLSAEDIYHALSLGNIAFLPEPVNAQLEGGSSNKSTALACVFSLGVPIVGIKGDMNNALLKDNDNILLANLNEPDSLYKALKNALNTEGSSDVGFGMSDLGRNAYATYQNTLSWEVIGQQFLGLMDVQKYQLS